MHSKSRVLFVDDEPHILSGLRRMLRSMRQDWEMAFATGGAEALEAMTGEPFNVIVSDMRMPGMDGVELLREVKARSPETVRLCLSGQAAKEVVLGSVGLVHQYQSKPCDADAIKATLSRLRMLHGLVGNDEVRGRLAGVVSVPARPAQRDRLMTQLQSAQVSINDVAETISRDVGLSAKVVQLVSSAFFAQPVHTLSPNQATIFLGMDVLKSLAVTVRAFPEFSQAASAATIDEISEHSLSMAECARQIAVAESADKDTITQAYIAGLFHDIGMLVFAEEFPDKCEQFLAARLETTGAWPETEREVFGATHMAAGAYLMGLWGLPDSVIEALAFHHDPSSGSAAEFCPLTAVHVADVLVRESAGQGKGHTTQLDEAYLAELGLVDRIPVWRRECLPTPQEEMINV